MPTDTIRLRDVVDTEIEQLEQYGEAAEEFFHQLSDDIKTEFTGTLEELLTHDLTAFQSQVNRSLAASGLSEVGGAVGDGLADIVGGILPDNVFGNVYGAAIGGALRKAAQDFARHGSFDLGRAVAAANRSGGAQLDRVMREGFPASRGQRSAEMWSQLQHGRRNL